MPKKNFKVGDYVVCLNNIDIEGLTVGKIYIVYKCYHNTGKDFFEIKNDNYIKRKSLCGLYTRRFKKATKKEINNNMADITYRKCIDAI